MLNIESQRFLRANEDLRATLKIIAQSDEIDKQDLFTTSVALKAATSLKREGRVCCIIASAIHSVHLEHPRITLDTAVIQGTWDKPLSPSPLAFIKMKWIRVLAFMLLFPSPSVSLTYVYPAILRLFSSPLKDKGQCCHQPLNDNHVVSLCSSMAHPFHSDVSALLDISC